MATGLASAPVPKAARKPVSRTLAARVLGALPLRFVPNRGQVREAGAAAKIAPVDYTARGAGFTLFLQPTAATLALALAPTPAKGATPQALPRATVRFALLGANARARARALDRLPGVSNYYIGAQRSGWRSGLPGFGRVRYANVYRGVDVVYYGTRRGLEEDLVLRPGADAGAIRIQAQGAPAALTPGGGVRLRLPERATLTLEAPTIYQTINGERHAVHGRWIALGHQEFGFRLGSYDRAAPLVIDPALVYSTYFGGSDSDQPLAIALDAAGDMYITGDTQSSDFPTSPGAFQTSTPTPASDVGAGCDIAGHCMHAFVSELSPTGALIYSTYLGGSSYVPAFPGEFNPGDQADAIAVDANGIAYVTGGTGENDFPFTGCIYSGCAGPGFLSAITQSGGLAWSSRLVAGGSGIALDNAGDIYLVGTIVPQEAASFPTTANAYQGSDPSLSNSHAFVQVISPGGPGSAGLLYSSYLGGNNNDGAVAVAAVPQCVCFFVAGSTDSTNFPVVGQNAMPDPSPGNSHVFVSEFRSTNGGPISLVASTYYGGDGSDVATAIAADPGYGGEVVVAGYSSSDNLPTISGAAQPSDPAPGVQHGFAAAFTGSTFTAGTYLGGNGADTAFGVAADAKGNVFVTGDTSSLDFPTTSDALQPGNLDGESKAFLTELGPGKLNEMYSTYLGGNGAEGANAIAAGDGARVAITGFTDSTTFPLVNAYPDVLASEFHYTGFVSAFSFCAVPGSGIGISRSGVRYVFLYQLYLQTLTLTNNTGATISGPFAVALTGLTAGVQIEAIGAAGGGGHFYLSNTSACLPPAGTVLMANDAISLAPGASVTLTLDFSDPARVPIAYTPVVVLGGGEY